MDRKEYLKELFKQIEDTFGCDTFFPQIPDEFKKIQESKVQEEKGLKFRFVDYARISK